MLQSVVLACRSAAVLATEDTLKIRRRTIRIKILLFIGLFYHLISAVSNFLLVNRYSAVLQFSIGAFSFFLGFSGVSMQWPGLLFFYVFWMICFSALTALGGAILFFSAVAAQFGLELEFSSRLSTFMTVAGLCLVVLHGLFCVKDAYFLARCHQRIYSETKADQKLELPVVHQPPFNFGKMEV